jgi:hypothetical protein
MGLNLNSLATDSERASLMFDYAGDPRGLIADILSALSEAGYNAGDGTGEAVPDELCGAVSATLGAAALYDVHLRVSAVGIVTAYDYGETQMAAETIMHAAHEHGDPLAIYLVGGTFPEVLERIESWVLDNMTADLDNVVALFASEPDFAEWESETSEPTTTA